MVDEVNPLVEELGVVDTSNIGPQNYESAEAENARMKIVFRERGEVSNPRHLVLEQVPSATVFDQPVEEKTEAEAYLARITALKADAANFAAENEKAKADQLAREAEQKAIADAAALAAETPNSP